MVLYTSWDSNVEGVVVFFFFNSLGLGLLMTFFLVHFLG